jgi:hypothetical protein
MKRHNNIIIDEDEVKDQTCPSCGPNGGPGCAKPADIHNRRGVEWITFSVAFFADFNLFILFDIFYCFLKTLINTNFYECFDFNIVLNENIAKHKLRFYWIFEIKPIFQFENF